MKRQNIDHHIPKLMAILYLASGDYVTFLRLVRMLFWPKALDSLNSRTISLVRSEDLFAIRFKRATLADLLGWIFIK